jgi:ADP-ribose pyrophosphatase YjhB (NUDIX family)
MDDPRHIVCVSGLFFNEAGEVLLVKTPRRGWECPGGQVELGEDLVSALLREVAEESGCEVQVETLAGVYTNPTPPEKVMFLFRGRHVTGVPRPSEETPEVGWFRVEQALEAVTFPSEAGKLRDALATRDRPIYRIYSTRPYTVRGSAFCKMGEEQMPATNDWTPAGPDLKAVLARYPDPLRALSEAQMPAIILRRAFDPEQCRGLIRRLIERGLMPDGEEHARSGDKRTRIDIGTSLGNRGADREAFLQHAQESQALFATLFEGFDNPVRTIYDSLAALAIGKDVRVAREPDGRLYGPAIFRIHYGGHTYVPHIDHVVLREKRFDYTVSRFPNQFAGVICFQNASHAGESTQATLHRCLWTPEVQPHIAAHTFHEYAAEHGIENYRVELEPGDLYFFNTRCIHEVPAVQGRDPRIVLATFIGYSPEEPVVDVWS